MMLVAKIHLLIQSLLDTLTEEEVLIFDDSLNYRNQSKKLNTDSLVNYFRFAMTRLKISNLSTPCKEYIRWSGS